MLPRTPLALIPLQDAEKHGSTLKRCGQNLTNQIVLVYFTYVTVVLVSSWVESKITRCVHNNMNKDTGKLYSLMATSKLRPALQSVCLHSLVQ